jgi:hypothetical protein
VERRAISGVEAQRTQKKDEPQIDADVVVGFDHTADRLKAIFVSNGVSLALSWNSSLENNLRKSASICG